MISEEQEARAARPGRLLPTAAAALGKVKVTASPEAIRLPLQVDSPAISALPTSHQCSPPPPLVVGAAGLDFSAVGMGRVGAFLGGGGGGFESTRALAGFPGGGEGDGDGVGVGVGGRGGAALWLKSRRMLMALVGSSPAMWRARMMSISGVPSPSTARTMATCSSRSFPISPARRRRRLCSHPAREIFPKLLPRAADYRFRGKLEGWTDLPSPHSFGPCLRHHTHLATQTQNGSPTQYP